MDENLFPEDYEDGEENIDVDQIIDEDEPVGYIEGVGFDTDIIRDGQNQIKSSAGTDSWKQWCINCIAMERGTSNLYNSDFGISTAEAFAAETVEETENILTAEITEALEADPYGRTESVDNVSFTWYVDYVLIDVEVSGIDEGSIDIQVTIGR